MQIRAMLKHGLRFFWRKMFRSLSAKFFATLVALIALSGITSFILCCKTARSKIYQLFILVFFKGL